MHHAAQSDHRPPTDAPQEVAPRGLGWAVAAAFVAAAAAAAPPRSPSASASWSCTTSWHHEDTTTAKISDVVRLLAANSIVVRFVHRYDWGVRLFEGSDVALVKDGRFVDTALRRQGLGRADVETALRAQGADGPVDVAEATLSPGGSIVVWLKPEEMSANRGDVAAIHARLAAIEQALLALRTAELKP